MRARWLALALVLPALLGALPPPPAHVELTPADEATVTARGIALRTAPGNEQSTAVIDVAASPAAVMAAVMDLEARVADIDGLTAVTVYETRPGYVATRWELHKLGLSVSFHVAYEFDLDAGWCTFRLDDARPNDIDATEGS